MVTLPSRQLLSITITSLLYGIVPVLAHADDDTTLQLTPITVTARHNTEQALDLPLTVNTITDRTMDNHTFTSLESVLTQTPGIDLKSYGGTGQAAIRMRGVGALNKVTLDDSSVVIYQNGIPLSLLQTGSNLFDMQSIEIIKGPQGTLYGRNSEAGIINLKPNQPESFDEYHIGAEIGNNGHYQGEAVLNTPIDGQTSIRLALQYRHNEHPYINLIDGKPLTEPNALNARLGLRWQGERDDIVFSGEHHRLRDFATANSLLGDQSVIAITPGLIEDNANHSNLSLNWHHEFDHFYLHSTTGWGKYSNSSKIPSYDWRISRRLYGQALHTETHGKGDKRHWFQELRIGSNDDAPFFWTAGVNYEHSKRSTYSYAGQSNDPSSAFDPFNAEFDHHFRTDSTALFGELTYPLMNSLDLTAGLRYSHEHTDYQADWAPNATYLIPGASAQQDVQSISNNAITGRLGLSYAVTENLKSYATYARGHKAGGFSDWDTSISSGQPATPYQSATIDSFEVGIKADIPEQGLSASTALFHNRTKGDHLYVLVDPLASYAYTTENVDTRSYGIELAANWHANDNLTLATNLAWTNATITGKTDNSRSPDIRIGNRVPDVARLSGGISAEYRQPSTLPLGLGQGNYTAFIGYQHTGKRAADAQNHFDLPAHNQIDARLGIESEHLELYLYATNLLGKRKVLNGYYLPAIPPTYGGTGKDAKAGALGAGRSVGVGFRYHF